MIMKYTRIKIYKYKLYEEMLFNTPITGVDYVGKFFTLTYEGTLLVNKGYAYDGPSGPSINTKPFIVASLPHDVFFQMIREDILNIEDHKDLADQYLRDLGREYGMSKLRTWWIYRAVKKFGKSSCVSDVITVNPV